MFLDSICISIYLWIGRACIFTPSFYLIRIDFFYKTPKVSSFSIQCSRFNICLIINSAARFHKHFSTNKIPSPFIDQLYVLLSTGSLSFLFLSQCLILIRAFLVPAYSNSSCQLLLKGEDDVYCPIKNCWHSVGLCEMITITCCFST